MKVELNEQEFFRIIREGVAITNPEYCGSIIERIEIISGRAWGDGPTLQLTIAKPDIDN